MKEVILKLEKFNPISIFLYGSQATKTTNSKSDYEMGVVFDDERYVSRQTLNQEINNAQYSIFPFKLSELENNTIDTPFQKNIFMKGLIEGGAKTIYGEQIIENLKSPNITNEDLLMDTHFNLGCALSAVKIFKAGNKDLANELFYKSALLSIRNLIYKNTHKLINGYENIYEHSKQLELEPIFHEMLKVAYDIRREEKDNNEINWCFKNITFINKFIIPALKTNPKK